MFIGKGDASIKREAWLLKIAVVSCGNLLLGDDGVGPFVLDKLRKRKRIPPEVELIELGVRGIDLVDLIGKFDKVLIIDAFKSGGKVGDICVLDYGELQHIPASPILTLHDLGLPTVLKLSEALYGNISSKVKVFGVEVDEVGKIRIGLTPNVKRGASEVARLVEKEIAGLLGSRV